MSATAEPTAQDYVGDYSYVPGGITNQKWALFGLFVEAIKSGRRQIVLPDLLVFDPGHDHKHLVDPSQLVRWDNYFDYDKLKDFGERHGVEMIGGPKIEGKFGWPYFRAGYEYVQSIGLPGRCPDPDLAYDFVRSLVSRVRSSELLAGIKRELFGTKTIDVVI